MQFSSVRVHDLCWISDGIHMNKVSKKTNRNLILFKNISFLSFNKKNLEFLWKSINIAKLSVDIHSAIFFLILQFLLRGKKKKKAMNHSDSHPDSLFDKGGWIRWHPEVFSNLKHFIILWVICQLRVCIYFHNAVHQLFLKCHPYADRIVPAFVPTKVF